MDRLEQLRSKEVISVADGERLGMVGDVGADLSRASLTHLIVPGKRRFWGLFGKREQILIPWEEIRTIGEETVLVQHSKKEEPEAGGMLSKLFPAKLKKP